MEIDIALAWINDTLFTTTGEHLTELQRVILQQVWNGKKYTDIANTYGCTEGHAKDVGSALWKHLTLALKQRVTKQNVRSLLERHLQPNSPLIPPLSNPKSSTFNSPQESPSFVGRTNAIAHLNDLVAQGTKIIVIQGEGGLGKTTLAQTYLHQSSNNSPFEPVLELLMAKESANITPVERVVEEWFSKDLGEEPGQDFGVTLGRLKRHLEQRRLGILIDNLEPALDKDGRLIPAHRRYVELLRVLADHRGPSLTLITSRDRLCESSVTVDHYRLPRLDCAAWQRFFHHRNIHPSPAILETIHHTYGGNAKAMGLLAGTVREDFDGDLDAYWQENSGDPLVVMDLKNLVVNQFERLRRLDGDAYRLLCRLGCYRYQSVAKVPTNGLIQLLWDVESGRQKQVITSLRNRSLIEFAKGDYWLHSVIRAEAIARLRQADPTPDLPLMRGGSSGSPPPCHSQSVFGELRGTKGGNSKIAAETGEWTLSHQQAATFWTESVTQIRSLSDAIAAWEAYYHYLAINDFEAASQVILHCRHNQWGQFLPLGSTLYRMGLLQPVLLAIEDILPYVQSERHVSELHNIFGDLLWITGNVHRAIAAQQQAITIARTALEPLQCDVHFNATSAAQDHSDNRSNHHFQAHQCYTFRMIEVDSLLSIGLYYIDLWDLPEAIHHFKTVIELADQTPHQAWVTKAQVCLALALSFDAVGDEMAGSERVGEKSEKWVEVLGLVDPIYEQLLDHSDAGDTARFAYFIQILAKTYANIGQWDRAKALYHQAMQFAETSHYTQVQARVLTGLAELERKQRQWTEALVHHQEAIALLETIGATCDLAEAYFQWGLTIQQQLMSSISVRSSDPALPLCPTDRQTKGKEELEGVVPDHCKIQVSQRNPFQIALQLFKTMNAPQQIAKVKGVIK